ncbi:hypothetical protein LUZ60_001275 [Juncus effusus]|nr:hypothetical protein LUZ60_001275 [Juncus effusus]
MDFTNKNEPPGTPLPLMRQGSVYSLTFDEFQSTLGGGSKDFGSMNMDELLKSIYSAEETQAIGAPSTMPSYSNQPVLPRQNSLTLPRTLSQKTVDTVWRDIMGFGTTSTNNNVYAGQSSAPPPAAGPAMVQQTREPTLGEMTLQEFLIRAGVVGDEPPVTIASFQDPSTVCENDFGKLSMPVTVNGSVRPFGVIGLGPNPVDSPVELSPVPMPVPYAFKGGLRGRKGAAVEKVVERRHRRMIKNRESAARSRARKQAYMMELEAEVAKLKEQNEKLQKKQTEIIVLQKTRVREQMNQQNRAKKQCLCRTFTGPW